MVPKQLGQMVQSHAFTHTFTHSNTHSCDHTLTYTHTYIHIFILTHATLGSMSEHQHKGQAGQAAAGS